ncbi:MAG TPA: TonB family protein [bacterium]|nr:TonB family protein [bacterium]
MKYTLAISAAAHLLFIATIIIPTYQGRNADSSQIISVSLLGGGATVTAAEPQPAKPAQPEEAQKEPEPAKPANSKMAYKTDTKEKKPKETSPGSKGKSTQGQKSATGSSGKGAGTGIGSGPGGGGNITVDNEDFRFAYYLEVLRERIGSNWSPPPVIGRGEVTATVYFRISRDGTVSEERVEKGSNQEIFDRAAVRAVKMSDPLPPLPAGFKGKWLGVHFEFQHSPG